MSRYMDPITDFGFKKLFGDEATMDITMSFLSAVLELQPPLLELSFPNREQLLETSVGRGSVYDLLCRDAVGNQYLIEMQKSRLAYIKDRMVYYSTFPIAGRIEALLLLLSQKLGPVPIDLETAISDLDDPSRIQALLVQLMNINDWEPLRALLLPPH